MIELLAFLSPLVNRLTELLKGSLEETFHLTVPAWGVLLMSQLIGVIAAYTLNFNAFADNPQYAFMPPLAGIVTTGLLVGCGSNIATPFFDLLAKFNERVKIEKPAAA